MDQMPSSSSPQMMMQAPPAKKKTWLWWLLGILGALVVGVLFFLWWILGGSSGLVKSAANDWLDLVGSGQNGQAYEQTSDAFKEGTPQEQWDAFLEAYPIMTSNTGAKFDSIERQSASGQQSSATLSGTLNASDGSTSPIEIILVDEGDAWKVYNVDLRGL